MTATEPSAPNAAPTNAALAQQLATLRSLKFGIELETTGLGREALARALAEVLEGTARAEARGWSVSDLQGRTWHVVRDASLSGGDQSGEIVSPILTYADLDRVQAVVRAVRAAGAKTDASTGIHIHVDGAAFTPKTLAHLVKIIHKQEALLEHALRIEAYRRTNYCKPISAAFLALLEAQKPATFEAFNACWYGRANPRPERYDASRYHGLNLNSFFFRKTIEFRYFNGSLHAGEVKAYLQLVLALAAKALTAKSASSARRAFDPATAKFDLRVLLVGLGMIGDEFKTARLHLTKHLAGSAAWKGERRDRRAAPAPAPVAAAPALPVLAATSAPTLPAERTAA